MRRSGRRHTRRHPAGTRLLFVPITGDSEVEQVQRELHARQRATQTALLREFAAGIDDAEAEPMGELSRAGPAAIAPWWLEHPEVPGDVPARVLLRMAEGLIASDDKRGGGSVRSVDRAREGSVP